MPSHFTLTSHRVVLFLLSCICRQAMVSAETYYATPSHDVSCPVEGVPCLTLNEYANKPHNYFASNATLIVQPGNHSLSAHLSISNTKILTIVGNSTNSHVSVSCGTVAMFTFENISEVHLTQMNMIGCGGTRVTTVEHFTLEHSSILGSGDSGTGLFLENVRNATVGSCDFAFNTGNPLHVDVISGFGGGAITAITSTIFITASTFHNNTGIENSQNADRIQLGGAIFAYDSSLSIESSIFQYNTVTYFEDISSVKQQGGAFYTWNCTIAIHNTSFTDNSANVGGALYLEQDSTITIDNSSFLDNVAIIGGAVAIDNGGIEVYDSIYNSNRALDNGGAIFIAKKCDATIQSGTFYNNRVLLGSGGAIFIRDQSYVSISGSTFALNQAPGNQSEGGGALYVATSGLLLQQCVFQNNTAWFGGAIATNTASILETQCTYSHNIAAQRGDTYLLFYSYLESDHCTYRENGAVRNGIPLGYTFMGYNFNTITFAHTTFSHNFGIVLFVFSSNATLNYTTFNNNQASGYETIYMVSVYNSSMSVYNSMFLNNIVGSAVLDIEPLSSVVMENTTFADNQMITIGIVSSGSVVTVHGSSYQVRGCTFINNNASTGGIVSVLDAGVELTNTAELHDTLFTNNSASTIGSVGCIGNNSQIILTNINLTENTGIILSAISCTIETHGYLYAEGNTEDSVNSIVNAVQKSTLKFLGKTSFVNNRGSIILMFASDITFDGETIFDSNMVNNLTTINTFQRGGAITAVQSALQVNGNVRFTNSTARRGGAIVIKESQLYVSGHFTISNNTGLASGGGMYAYQSQLNFRGLGVIQRNIGTEKGGGVHAIGTTITLTKGSLHFIENSASQGGGIYMEQNSKLYINKEVVEMPNCTTIPSPAPIGCNNDSTTWLRLEFTNNSAKYGGGVNIDDENSGTCDSTTNTSNSAASECFIQTLILYGTLSKEYLENVNEANTFFNNNVATQAGNDLYGGLLDRCTRGQFAEQLLLYQAETNLTSYVFNITNLKPDNKSVNSRPSRVCFCRDDQIPDCEYKPPIRRVNRGLPFRVSVVAVDQVNHSIPATIHGALSSHSGGFGEGQASQNTLEKCTQLNYSIVSPQPSELVNLYAEGPCKDVGISQNFFEVAFHPCSCPIGFQIPPNEANCSCDCDPAIKPYVVNCTFVTKTVLRESNTWITYVNDSDGEGFIIYPHCPFDYCYPPTYPVSINFNVPEGADSQCAFNRSSMLCGACKDGLSLSLGSSRCQHCSNSWLALLFPFGLAGIALVAFLLVLNLTVAIGTINGLIFYANIIAANRAIFFPFQPNFLTVFVSWLNLDLGIETCFYNGMDGYSKTWLQLVFPAYLIFLVVMIIILCDYSIKFAKLFTGTNPVAILATLVLLSYTKFLRVIIAAMSFAIVEFPDSYREVVWLFDANILYLRGKHIPLFLAAVAIIVVGLFYTFTLFCWQWILHLPRWKLLRIFQNTRVYGLIDTYHAPHSPDNLKHRYWTGLLLLVRIILYLVSAVNVNGDPRVNLVCITSVIVGLFVIQHFTIRYLNTWIYNNWFLDILECSFFLNLIVFATATFYITESEKNQYILACISATIAFFTFVVIILYHLYKFTFNRTIQKIISRLRAGDDHSQRSPSVSDSVQVEAGRRKTIAADPESDVSCTEFDALPPQSTETCQSSDIQSNGGAGNDERTLLLSGSQRTKKN